MDTDKIKRLKDTIKNLQSCVQVLKREFLDKSDGFTLDGRMVGDIGEVIAAEVFQIKLHEGVAKYYDAVATYDSNVNVQIKATFKSSLTYNHDPDYFIGIKLFENGDFRVVYNGPGRYIANTYSHRKGIGKNLLSFPISKLAELSAGIPEGERILLKENIVANEVYYKPQ